jgi:hypothetical protein
MGAHTSFRVALEAQHDLWCSVPSRCNVLRHVARILIRVDAETSRQTEIANLELTVGINQQVARFEIAMQHICAVDVLKTTQNLIDEGLEMGVCERLAGTDDGS